ncbi:excinuclease ABC subunit A [Symbiobacterium terraclitae]|uniref:UvrABC system protein A n=1 Tax=Symbiobacterium terraclitae TaxID=557451 RepID=A0ABS4JT05_9FIRM|nr:excinuclease ABC subunit A [Symbiobacterium terraclitae]
MAKDRLVIKGARQHNLKNINLEIPRDKLVVLTGVSGSGKSSLAFDTIYAEGQRRYVESLSAYARQFLGQMDKPDVDSIDGLSPAISIDQKTTSRNPRSTVGTVTEIYDYLRLLYARIGRPHCPTCGKPIQRQTVDQMVDALLRMEEGTRIQVLAPLVRGRKGEHVKVFEDIRRGGYVRMRVDGQIMDVTDEPPALDKKRKHTIEVVVDRLVIRPDIERRLADSLEIATKLAGGIVTIDVVGGEELLFSENFACPDCGVSIDEPQPRNFSFNSPFGACPACTGLGFNTEFDPELVLDPSLSLDEGALVPWANSTQQFFHNQIDALCSQLGIRKDVPLNQQDPKFREILLFGWPDGKVRFQYENMYGQRKWYEVTYEGAIKQLDRMFRETSSDAIRDHLAEFMTTRPCPACHGARLKPESLAVKVGGLSIAELTDLDVAQARKFLAGLDLTEKERAIGRQILKEIDARLGFLINVGLDYLTLSRSAGSLSGGEAQRIRLATQIGSHLVGVLYILDEPSIGLHQRDNERLIETLQQLRDLGNTLIVVEHDEDTIRAADWVVDIGPGAGQAGGRVVAAGPVEKILATPESLTGAYLSGRRQIPIPEKRRQPNGKWLVVRGAREHNLKDITFRVPLGTFTVVTGVSGSGKSTLVNEILYRRLAAELNRARTRPGAHDAIEGLEHLDKVIDIDQSPIGRTPRSNPATYTGVFDLIRELMAQTPEAKMRGYKQGRFSFNVRGGRCEACKGDGIIKIEMHFLPDVYVPCEVCKGARYNRETLEVHYKGKTIADILNMTVDEAVEFFRPLPRIYRKMQTLQDVGLGYIKLGQPATTLSGGEAQRVKLATELSRRATGRTIYILDEPTTGLHTADVHKLLDVLQRLVDVGNTVLVIEHNLDVIKQADWIVDLGPEGGERGGQIVAEGPPEEVCANPASYTGLFLKRHMERQRAQVPLGAASGTD